ncbi:MAG: hypothetical protein RI883_575 [Bacteroidota bacterium]|jgi:hypothetical protein
MIKKRLFLIRLIIGVSIFSLTTSFNFLSIDSKDEKSNGYISLNNIDDELLRQKWENAAGTFQFQIINSREFPQVHVSIIEEIEKNRDEKDIVYIPYKENIRIKILPKSMISGSFEKLELFIRVSE